MAIDGDHEGISELAIVGSGDRVGGINMDGMKEGAILLVGNSVGIIDGLDVEDRDGAFEPVGAVVEVAGGGDGTRFSEGFGVPETSVIACVVSEQKRNKLCSLSVELSRLIPAFSPTQHSISA